MGLLETSKSFQQKAHTFSKFKHNRGLPNLLIIIQKLFFQQQLPHPRAQAEVIHACMADVADATGTPDVDVQVLTRQGNLGCNHGFLGVTQE